MANPYGQSPYAPTGAGLRPGYAGSAGPANFNNSAHARSSSLVDPASTDAALSKVRAFTSKVEDLIDTHTQSIKPYLPALGRFLIVVTFLEDALRIVTQWSDQRYYLQKHRHFPWGTAPVFLIVNVLVMLAASGAVIARRYPEPSVFALLGVVIVQGFGYGLIFDINFFLRNLSVIGGLLMVLSDSLGRKRNLFAGLPSISESDKRVYLQLAGRVLLIFLFIGFIIQGNWSIARVVVSVLGLGACVMVAVGFKARWSALFLILLLSVFNILVNNFWMMHHAHPARDFLRYDFFQTLSIVGGLLLLVNQGAGAYSLDERKKAT